MHSGGGFGIFGMGVLFEEMGAEQHSAIGAWLRKLAGRPGKDLGKNSFLNQRLNRTESAGRIVKSAVKTGTEIRTKSEACVSMLPDAGDLLHPLP